MKKTIIKGITLSILLALLPTTVYAKRPSIFGALIGGATGNAVANGASNSLSEEDKIKMLKEAARRANLNAPQQIDEATTFINAKVLTNPIYMVYQFKINFYTSDINKQELSNFVLNNNKNKICKDMVYKHNVDSIYEYYDINNSYVTSVNFTKSTCQ